MAKYVDYDFENCDCECDECGYDEIIDSTDYSDINKKLRNDGWIIKNINGDWKEFCSQDCYETYCKSENL